MPSRPDGGLLFAPADFYVMHSAASASLNYKLTSKESQGIEQG